MIGGADWPARFRRCLDRSSSCTITCDSAYLDDMAMFGFAGRVAMGHALNRAQFLGVEAMQLAVSDGRASGTARDIGTWHRAAGITQVIDVESRSTMRSHAALSAPTQVAGCQAVIFADFHGFSRLRDEHYEAFISGVLGAIGQTIDGFGDDVLYRNSWGDAIQLVIRDVISAAKCALAIQNCLVSLDLASLGLPADLRLRVAGHVGRLINSPDPIRGVSGFWGREIDPSGANGAAHAGRRGLRHRCISALVALEPDARLACEYVGMVTTAKNFETIPMYRLRRR